LQVTVVPLANLLPATPHMKPKLSTWLPLTGLTALFFVWILANPAWVGEFFRLMQMAAGLTLAVVWGVLLWKWKRLSANSVPTLDDLYALTPLEFEEYTAQLFQQKGYDVTMRGGSGDMGVDVLLTKENGQRAVVQCKRYRHTVGPDTVRELFGTMVHERVHHAFLVTTAPISENARKWAADKPLTLIDGTLLIEIAAALNAKNKEKRN